MAPSRGSNKAQQSPRMKLNQTKQCIWYHNIHSGRLGWHMLETEVFSTIKITHDKIKFTHLPHMPEFSIKGQAKKIK